VYESAPLKVALELDRGTGPIAGRLLRADGTAMVFTGWLELTQALEAVRETTGEEPHGQTGGEPHGQPPPAPCPRGSG
jgi:hypothetical protein